jgi:uncharacterized integral membrane protein
MAVEEPKQVVVERERRSSTGTIVAIVVGVIILIAFLMYGLPYITGSNNSTTNVNVPAPTAESPAGN